MNITRFFMQRDTVHTTLSGTSAVVCFRVQSGILADVRLEQESTRTALLGTDSGDSVLQAKTQAQLESVSYNAYGLHGAHDMPAQRPAYNGHLLVSGFYLLGNGYRGYNPVLMRFLRPDSLSPFGIGGLNCYAYCAGDPINFSDSSGHMKRSRSPSTLIGQAMDAWDAWDAWDAKKAKEAWDAALLDELSVNLNPAQKDLDSPVQTNQQRTFASNFAQAQSVPSIGDAVKAKPNHAQRRTEGKFREWGLTDNKRKKLEGYKVAILEAYNAKDSNSLYGLSEDESRAIRTAGINAMRDGGVVVDAIYNSGYGLTRKQSNQVRYGLSRALRERLKRVRN